MFSVVIHQCLVLLELGRELLTKNCVLANVLPSLG